MNEARRQRWRRLWKGQAVLLSAAVVLLLLVFVGLFAPWLVPHDPGLQDLNQVLQPPGFVSQTGAVFVLGTDALGRDVLSRLMYGARISLLVGVLTVAVRGGMGVLLGLLSGFYGGRIDDLLMRIADVQLALPFLVVAIAIMSVLGPGLFNLIVVLGLTGWVVFGRVVRSEVLSLRQRDFVTAAKAAGARDMRILFRHILPNTLSAVMVIGTLQVAQVIITEASLSFLGLGVGTRIPTWGQMIAEGRQHLANAWWLSIFPGLVIFVTVLSINLMGDWLRDRFDPRLRQGT